MACRFTHAATLCTKTEFQSFTSRHQLCDYKIFPNGDFEEIDLCYEVLYILIVITVANAQVLKINRLYAIIFINNNCLMYLSRIMVNLEYNLN